MTEIVKNQNSIVIYLCIDLLGIRFITEIIIQKVQTHYKPVCSCTYTSHGPTRCVGINYYFIL